MKILFCNYEYPPLGGGGGVINAQLAAELATRHEVAVLTTRALDSPERDVMDGVDVIRVNVMGRNHAAAANMVSMASYLPMAMQKGRRLFSRQSFDVINTHFVLPTGPVGAYLARRLDIPNVLTVHGGDLYDPSKSSSPHRHWILRVLVRRLLHRASAVVAQSENTADNVARFYDDEVPVELIPLGINRPAASRRSRQDLGIDDEEFVMITVGRLVARKAVHQLVDMMKSFTGRPAKLIVIGDGPLLGELESRARDLSVADRIRFAGFVDEQEKVDLLAAADLYVSTSQHEGFGLVFLEGMAAGMPVVCYDFGGQTDFLEDGKTGALVPLNDEAAFFAACRHFSEATASRREAGDENLRRVESFYIDNCATRYEALFESVLRESGKSR